MVGSSDRCHQRLRYGFLYAPFICFAIAAFFKFRAFERLCEMKFRGKKTRSKKTKNRENVEFSLLNQERRDEILRKKKNNTTKMSSSSPFSISRFGFQSKVGFKERNVA